MPPERMPGERKLAGVIAYDEALDELIANAAHTIRIFDKNIGRNFNTPQRYDLLGKFLLAHRTSRVKIVLHETANIVRDCPRLILLLKRFSHGLAIHQTLPAARRVYDPFAVAGDTRFVRRFHHTDMRGAATIGDVAATSLLVKRFDEIWEASTPAVAATT
ncbi:MAG: hypothetical protein NTW47_12760, partial [Proteobacteria bacterium]|nr:hypothetical protein [Pseudomonadota bacterium]